MYLLTFDLKYALVEDSKRFQYLKVIEPPKDSDLQKGDEILSVDGRFVAGKYDLCHDILEGKKVGDSVSVQVAREGQ